MKQLICACFLLVGYAALAEEIRAHVDLTDYSTDKATDGGYLDLVQKDGKLTITGKLTNLKPSGNHGFHVHEKGEIGNKCNDSGAHYNPLKKTHGAPDSSERHIGDLGNIKADEQGNAEISITDSIALLDGQYSIIGRSIVIHKGEDDLGKKDNNGSKTTGNAGSRLRCGVIQKQDSSAATSLNSIFLTFFGLFALVYCFQQ
ncbi:Superoxide dismutase [Aphelenchoides bicaudatus]|nr:Superoxide dismutase [Aphelenchoides bicaudatus]